LSSIEALKGLTEEEFTWLATHGTQRLGKDGDLIFSQGAPPEHLMFILDDYVLVNFSRRYLGTEDRLTGYLDWLSRLSSPVSHSRQTGNRSADTTLLEDSLMNWLEEKSFAEGWKLAAVLAEANIQLSSLEELESLVPVDTVCIAVSDAMAALEREASVLEISDTGKGIPAECAARIFEPFFTTKPFGKGLGLGLDTVQRVIQKHFGAVAFDSTPTKTTFHVRLPLDRAEVY
jgi:Histidine kinase-, DNA gyrase B-, and HSP90-like ATPase